MISEQDSLIGTYSSYQSFRDLEGQVGPCKHIDIEACLDISTTSTQEELQTSAEITKAYILSAFIMVLNTFGVPRVRESYPTFNCSPKSIARTPLERYAIASNSGKLMTVEGSKKVSLPPVSSTSRLGYQKIRGVIEEKTSTVKLLRQERPYHIKKSKSGLHHFR